jgi:putative thioredoxin
VQALKAAGNYAAAQASLQQLITRDPKNLALLTEAAELCALDGDVDAAKQALSRLQAQDPNHPSVKRLGALITFSDVIARYPDVLNLRKQLAGNPEDLDLRHALAVHQLLGGDVEPALQSWLGMLREHRQYGDDRARRSLVMAFELIGDSDPIVSQTRRAMAKLLF